MRSARLAFIAGMIFLAACPGSDGQDGTTLSADSAARGATPAGGTVQAAPITGETHDVRMMFDGARYFFEPATLTIRPGDGVRWTMVSGAPHNVEFRSGQFPAAAAEQLAANMPEATGLLGKMLMTENEQYTVSFANLPAGTYNYICTPHEALGMKATITVE